MAAAEWVGDDLRAELEANPVGAAFLENDFCLTAKCLDQYARVAAQAGGAAAGAAACTALGVTSLAAPLCSAVGAWLGGKVLDLANAVWNKVGPASGQSLGRQRLDTTRAWLEGGGPARARHALLAQLAYATERRAAVGRIVAVAAGETEAAVSQRFSARGAPTLEQAASFLGWRMPGDDNYPDFSKYQTTTEVIEPDPNDDPELWVAWKVAKAATPTLPVTSYRLREAMDLLGPPLGGRQSAFAIGKTREWQSNLRESEPAVRAAAQERAFIDVSGQPDTFALTEGTIRRRKRSGGLLVAGGLAVAIAASMKGKRT